MQDVSSAPGTKSESSPSDECLNQAAQIPRIFPTKNFVIWVSPLSWVFFAASFAPSRLFVPGAQKKAALGKSGFEWGC
jgi:hypothetical protein